MPALALVALGLGSTMVPADMAHCLSMRDVEFLPILETNDVQVRPLALAHMPLDTERSAH